MARTGMDMLIPGYWTDLASANDAMWSSELFQLIAERSLTSAHIATYSAAGFVRRGLSEVGFQSKNDRAMAVTPRYLGTLYG